MIYYLGIWCSDNKLKVLKGETINQIIKTYEGKEMTIPRTNHSSVLINLQNIQGGPELVVKNLFW